MSRKCGSRHFTHGANFEEHDMNSTLISVVARLAAAVAAIATSMALLSAVASFSEPQRSQLLAATAGRQMAAQKHSLQVAEAKQAQPTAVTELTAR